MTEWHSYTISDVVFILDSVCIMIWVILQYFPGTIPLHLVPWWCNVPTKPSCLWYCFFALFKVAGKGFGGLTNEISGYKTRGDWSCIYGCFEFIKKISCEPVGYNIKRLGLNGAEWIVG